MAHRISFFSYSEWDSDRGCVAFIALVDGVRARCLIPVDALVELTQEKALSPILAFSEHRDAVQELARALIEKERLDGRELMIRLSDVQECQAAVAASAATAAKPPAEIPIDGRQMTMSEESRVSVWADLCDRQTQHCESVSRHAHEELAARAQQETGVFKAQTTPPSAHALNLRRVEAGRMTESWQAQLSRPAEGIGSDIDLRGDHVVRA